MNIKEESVRKRKILVGRSAPIARRVVIIVSVCILAAPVVDEREREDQRRAGGHREKIERGSNQASYLLLGVACKLPLQRRRWDLFLLR
jgi:hypothetical protein